MIVINEMCMNTESGIEYVTIYTIYGEIELGKLDEQGRLIWRSDRWIIAPEEIDERDKILRKEVKEIIRDGGKEYRKSCNTKECNIDL